MFQERSILNFNGAFNHQKRAQNKKIPIAPTISTTPLTCAPIYRRKSIINEIKTVFGIEPSPPLPTTPVSLKSASRFSFSASSLSSDKLDSSRSTEIVPKLPTPTPLLPEIHISNGLFDEFDISMMGYLNGSSTEDIDSIKTVVEEIKEIKESNIRTDIASLNEAPKDELFGTMKSLKQKFKSLTRKPSIGKTSMSSRKSSKDSRKSMDSTGSTLDDAEIQRRVDRMMEFEMLIRNGQVTKVIVIGLERKLESEGSSPPQIDICF